MRPARRDQQNKGSDGRSLVRETEDGTPTFWIDLDEIESIASVTVEVLRDVLHEPIGDLPEARVRPISEDRDPLEAHLKARGLAPDLAAVATKSCSSSGMAEMTADFGQFLAENANFFEGAEIAPASTDDDEDSEAEFIDDLSIDDWLNIRNTPDLPGHAELLEKMPFSIFMVTRGLRRPTEGS
jgi:hypothetical protein